MPRPRPDDDRSAGQDSFLDVVTNIVGILIILVMVIGARVRQITLEAPTPVAAEPPAVLQAEVAERAKTLASSEQEIEELQDQLRLVGAAIEGASQARLDLATAVAASKRGVEVRKQAADASRVAAAERSARRRMLEDQIRTISLETESLAHAPATTKEVLAFPTPIGRTVNGDEIHFRIAGGRIAYIPLEELFELAKAHTRRNSNSLSDLATKIVSVGPAQGFSLDYVIEAKVDQARGQVLIRSREWVVRPAELSVGEPVAEALGGSSKFRRTLAGVKPDTTVTLWCYPDSFEGYRAVRAELYRLGIATAGRPLPEGAPIGGSTEGSKSVAQ
jgi:DNA-directed RNA polymerase subunit K/omega